MDQAEAFLQDETSRPTGSLQFTNLRDVLIFVMQVTSLRRVMEFSEFRILEYNNIQKIFKEWTDESRKFLVRVSRHKTAEKGPCQIFLIPRQERCLRAYMLYYRPLNCSCTSPDCYMFPNMSGFETTGCCSMISYSTISKSLKRAAERAGFASKISSRMLRRSQTTAFWEKDVDPSWRSKVADQSDHAVDTARRYYDFSSKMKPREEVIDSLSKQRQSAVDTDTAEKTTADEEGETNEKSEAEAEVEVAGDRPGTETPFPAGDSDIC